MTEKLIAVEIDGFTGEVIERGLTLDEKNQRDLDNQALATELSEREAKKAARESALAKLAALGLTETEIAAL